jgi:hypothetical protein
VPSHEPGSIRRQTQNPCRRGCGGIASHPLPEKPYALSTVTSTRAAAATAGNVQATSPRLTRPISLIMISSQRASLVKYIPPPSQSINPTNHTHTYTTHTHTHTHTHICARASARASTGSVAGVRTLARANAHASTHAQGAALVSRGPTPHRLHLAMLRAKASLASVGTLSAAFARVV